MNNEIAYICVLGGIDKYVMALTDRNPSWSNDFVFWLCSLSVSVSDADADQQKFIEKNYSHTKKQDAK